MQQSLFLTQQASSNLCAYQIERIETELIDYLNINKQANDFNITVCPKCGRIHPVLVENGKTKARKQMYQCKSYMKKFELDHGQLTFYSYKPQSKWNDFIIDT